VNIPVIPVEEMLTAGWSFVENSGEQMITHRFSPNYVWHISEAAEVHTIIEATIDEVVAEMSREE